MISHSRSWSFNFEPLNKVRVLPSPRVDEWWRNTEILPYRMTVHDRSSLAAILLRTHQHDAAFSEMPAGEEAQYGMSTVIAVPVEDQLL